MARGPVLIVSGTNRPDSYALRLARAVLGHYQRLDIPAEVYSLCDLPLDIYSPAAYKHKPESFAPIQQKVFDASGLHLVVPEYNGSFPGVLKYFIDMLKYPESFDRKPIAYIGESNGAWGALRPVEQLQMVFGYRNAYTYPVRLFVSKVKEKFDADARVVDADLDGRLARQAEGFWSFIHCLGAVPKG